MTRMGELRPLPLRALFMLPVVRLLLPTPVPYAGPVCGLGRVPVSMFTVNLPGVMRLVPFSLSRPPHPLPSFRSESLCVCHRFIVLGRPRGEWAGACGPGLALVSTRGLRGSSMLLPANTGGSGLGPLLRGQGPCPWPTPRLGLAQGRLDGTCSKGTAGWEADSLTL